MLSIIMNNLRPFVELQCDDLDIIQSKVLEFLTNRTDIFPKKLKNWQFLDTRPLLQYVPELQRFFMKNHLVVRDAAVTVLYEDLPLHIDQLPVIAKINFPINKTQGWVNRWYTVDDAVLENCPKFTNEFGDEIPALGTIPKSELKLAAEIKDLSTPIVFHSLIPHEVINLTATEFPRIVASFTFHNQPVDLLK